MIIHWEDIRWEVDDSGTSWATLADEEHNSLTLENRDGKITFHTDGSPRFDTRTILEITALCMILEEDAIGQSGEARQSRVTARSSDSREVGTFVPRPRHAPDPEPSRNRAGSDPANSRRQSRPQPPPAGQPPSVTWAILSASVSARTNDAHRCRRTTESYVTFRALGLRASSLTPDTLLPPGSPRAAVVSARMMTATAGLRTEDARATAYRSLAGIVPGRSRTTTRASPAASVRRGRMAMPMPRATRLRIVARPSNSDGASATPPAAASTWSTARRDASPAGVASHGSSRSRASRSGRACRWPSGRGVRPAQADRS